MAADELTKPLGLPAPPRRPRAVRAAALIFTAVTVAALTGTAALWFANRAGPTATATIKVPGPGEVSLADRTGSTTRPGVDEGSGIDEVEPQGGLVEIGKVVIHDLSEPPPMPLSAAPDGELIEAGADGPLPKVASNGRRPLDAYARPSDADSRDTRIAIVVGGVGIDPEGTARAIAELPGEVTLALVPYGDDLSRTLSEARAAGHEILLQVPLEPYNYPQSDPGPQTLTTDASADENLSRLRWLMSRMTSYVGVVNYLGGRFTSETPALTPVLEEIGRRGLLYLDDGSSPRSVAETVAAGRAPFLKADLVLDADLSAAAIDRRLNELRMIARERGYAIGTATAFPIAIERIAAFARIAADRNVTIVPLSALAGAGRT
ncbi:MAG: divergent polysaccharide deacetylase family protein [Bauldia sp.]